MRTVFGVTNVSSAGTAVQLNNATNRVKYIKVKALAGNSGIAYLGASDVSATANSYELSATNELELNFGEFGGSFQLTCSMQTQHRTTIKFVGLWS